MDTTVLTGILLVFAKELVDLLANLALRNLDIVLGSAVLGHEGEETVIGDVELAHTSAR
jgi:hypothetical protein